MVLYEVFVALVGRFLGVDCSGCWQYRRLECLSEGCDVRSWNGVV